MNSQEEADKKLEEFIKKFGTHNPKELIDLLGPELKKHQENCQKEYCHLCWRFQFPG